MQIFAVVGTRNDQRARLVELAKENYTDANVYDINNALFIAASGETTTEVSKKVGIGGVPGSLTGVVVMVDYYWGFHAKELWEWMAARSKANGI